MTIEKTSKPLRGEPLERLREFILTEKVKNGTEYTELAERWGVSRTLVFNLVRHPIEKRTKKIQPDLVDKFFAAFPDSRNFILYGTENFDPSIDEKLEYELEILKKRNAILWEILFEERNRKKTDQPDELKKIESNIKDLESKLRDLPRV